MTGHGPDRVSTARIDGHVVVVRSTQVDQAETWVIDVDQLRCGGQYVARSQALSREAVLRAVAIAEARRTPAATLVNHGRQD
jgi:hypothetical protein